MDPNPMICFEIVDLFLEAEIPYIFAQKLDHIERIRKSWSIA